MFNDYDSASYGLTDAVRTISTAATPVSTASGSQSTSSSGGYNPFPQPVTYDW